MTIAALLQSSEAQAALQSLTSAFGLDAAQAKPAITTMAQELAHRIQRNMISRGGVADVAGLLTDPRTGVALNRSSALASPQVADEGNHILDVLIGDKHVSRGIAHRAAAETGIDEGVAKKLLPVVASMLFGGLQKASEPQLAKLARDVPVLAASGSGRLPGPGNTIPGLGRPTPSEPDAPSNNPFENLPDVIRRGGTQVPGGGSLEDIIRSIVGGLLGVKNRGMIGNIVQALVIRWVVNLVRRFFTRR